MTNDADSSSDRGDSSPWPVIANGSSEGVWIVATASGSRYILDLEAMTLTRAIAPHIEDPSAWRPRAQLRKDGSPLPLLDFSPVTVGEPWELTLDQVDSYIGYISTVRLTTPVTSVRRIPPGN